MKRVLIVSPHFPPLNAPDMQRVRMSLPFYRSNGWEAVVLTVSERLQEGFREPLLIRTLPEDLRVVFSGALSIRLGRLLGIGNIGLRAWPFLLWSGISLLRREKFDLIFISTTQFIVFSLGPLWLRLSGVPYVLDVQDPWLTDHYEKPGSRPPPGGWKYRFSRLQAKFLEKICFKGAAGIMSVSPLYIELLRARYPEVATKPSAVICFGASLRDLEISRSLPPAAHTPIRGGDERHLVYTGAAGPLSLRLLAVLFSALREYRQKYPENAGRFLMHFVGTSYARPGAGHPAILPIAERHSVSSLVKESPHRIGFFEALKLQQDSDALLLVGSDDRSYSPSKLFSYCLTGRPILALVFRDSVIERQLDEIPLAFVVRWNECEPEGPARAQLLRFFEETSARPVAQSAIDSGGNALGSQYFAEELTKKQCALFDQSVLPEQTP